MLAGLVRCGGLRHQGRGTGLCAIYTCVHTDAPQDIGSKVETDLSDPLSTCAIRCSPSCLLDVSGLTDELTFPAAIFSFGNVSFVFKGP